MNLNEQFADLAKLNTDTYCHDLAYTAFVLTCTELSKRGKAQIVALADRIIAEREREASALRTNEAREQAELRFAPCSNPTVCRPLPLRGNPVYACDSCRARVAAMSRATFFAAYVEAALWSSTVGEEGTPMDADYSVSDIAPVTLETMRAECEDFQAANAELLDQAGSDEQNGHDFWLTRNRHGAGFWDRGYPEAIGRGLTDAAHACGECDLYPGADGLIYC